MTLEEKIGQMTQLTVAAVATRDPSGAIRFDAAKLREAIVDRHVGSMLNIIDVAQTLDQWHAVVGQIQEVAAGTRLRIPVIYGIDSVHGANFTRGATIFPHNIGLAATFDPGLVRETAEITARETLASGLPWNFAPVLDAGRQPVWPRFYETFGEAPHLVAELGRAAILGLQSSGRVAATMKHFVGYSGSRTGRDRTPAALSERDVREHYLPPFRAAIEAGAQTVMINSGEIDGMPVHASRYWVTHVLREELGFTGVAVTDYADVLFLHTRHRVAPTIRDAVRLIVEAGIDVCMAPDNYAFADHLLALVRDGTISSRRIDASVTRILSLKVRLGLFSAWHPDPCAVLATPAARDVARRAARESLTLLKNDGILPLRRDARVLVTGPGATSLTMLNGGWTYSWQGTDASIYPSGIATLADAVGRYTSNVVAAGQDADVAIVAVGEDAYAEWLGDIADLTLPEPQRRLVTDLAGAGVPVVLVLAEGRPRIIQDIADVARGILMAYWPGMEGADAIANVLFGETNPSGRLPFTYPRHPHALLLDDHRFTETLDASLERGPGGFAPQWLLGTGLSYTTFDYADLRLGRSVLRAGERLTVRVTITNTGDRAGRETALLFTRQHYASLTPAVRRLKGFDSVTLEPGASHTFAFTLEERDLSYVGQDGRPVIEPGAFDVMIGPLTGTFSLAR